MVNRESPASTERPAGTLTGTTRPGEPGQNREFLDVVALIRSIQKAEGNEVCFQTGRTACGQPNCAWRNYCLGTDWRSPGPDPSIGLLTPGLTSR